MQKSKTVGIILIVALGASFAVNAKAEETVTTTTTKTVVTSVKKQPVKSVKPKSIKQVQKPLRAKKVVKAVPRTKVVKTAMVKPESSPLSPAPETQPPPQPVPPVNPNAANTLAMTAPLKPEESEFKVAVSAEFYPDNDVQLDSKGVYYVFADYKPAPKHKFSFTGRVAQTIIAEPGKETSVAALDPKFDYFYKFTEPDQKNFDLKMRFRSMPGWSDDSRLNGVMAYNSVRLEFSKPIGDFSFGLRPYVGHYWTEYAVNAKNEPLPLFVVGHNLAMSYKFTKKFSWELEVDTGFKMLQPEEVRTAQAFAEANGTPAPKTVETVKTALLVVTQVAYQFTKSFATRLGYLQDDGLIDEGKYTLNMFGRQSSRYYVGLDYSF
ncbi:MAG: hypothetical protein A4S09_16455 [Proteobacteria bacterium SG_bin7]|nr:MAG: hypothetical protein A4S09_16455 [Proteobacteria bacterium SG_bin7]